MPADTRINIRVTEEQKKRLQHAAWLSKMSLTAFMLKAAVEEADRINGSTDTQAAETSPLVGTSSPEPVQDVVEKVQEPPARKPTFSELTRAGNPYRERYLKLAKEPSSQDFIDFLVANEVAFIDDRKKH